MSPNCSSNVRGLRGRSRDAGTLSTRHRRSAPANRSIFSGERPIYRGLPARRSWRSLHAVVTADTCGPDQLAFSPLSDEITDDIGAGFARQPLVMAIQIVASKAFHLDAGQIKRPRGLGG